MNKIAYKINKWLIIIVINCYNENVKEWNISRLWLLSKSRLLILYLGLRFINYSQLGINQNS